MTAALTTPLHAAHHEAGGRFVVFAGWRMPVHYGSILAEARAVRQSAGMFDVSHMGRLRVRGPGALDLLNRLGTNDLAKVEPGRAQYTLWCTPEGGVIDDLIVWWMDDADFVVVVNASRHDVDASHLQKHASGMDVTIVDETQPTTMIAVQGPGAVAALERLGDLNGVRRFGVVRTTLDGVGAIVARTGYTGEDGVEIACDAGAGPRLWETLRAAGVRPCGLGARDALRMEMGYPLYGHELSEDISPLDAGVGFAVALNREFVGSGALRSHKQSRRLAGFVCGWPCVPAPGDQLSVDGETTSGGTSVVLDKPIGLGFVPSSLVLPSPATLTNRGKEVPVEIRELPLIDRRRPAQHTAA